MNLKDKLAIFSFLIVAIFGLNLLTACSDGAARIDPMNKSKNILMAEKGVTLNERLGVDDNAAIAIVYGSDMQGSLDVCG